LIFPGVGPEVTAPCIGGDETQDAELTFSKSGAGVNALRLTRHSYLVHALKGFVGMEYAVFSRE
jgi:hypothetical protein